MAHKTLIDGTAYSIDKGKTLINGTAYSISKGKTLVNGTGYGVDFSNQCTVTYYKIDNNEYENGTGPVTKDGSEYYLRVTINGTVLPGLGDSMASGGQSQVRTITVPKGAELSFQLINTGEKDRGAVYLNDNKVAGNAEYCYYTTAVNSNMTITFTWEGEKGLENWTYLYQNYWIARIYT